jgi:hypothetical protein
MDLNRRVVVPIQQLQTRIGPLWGPVLDLRNVSQRATQRLKTNPSRRKDTENRGAPLGRGQAGRLSASAAKPIFMLLAVAGSEVIVSSELKLVAGATAATKPTLRTSSGVTLQSHPGSTGS